MPIPYYTICYADSTYERVWREEDYKAMRKAQLSDSQIYHCAGDSIVVSVLMGIFGTLLGVEDYEQRINELTDRLV